MTGFYCYREAASFPSLQHAGGVGLHVGAFALGYIPRRAVGRCRQRGSRALLFWIWAADHCGGRFTLLGARWRGHGRRWRVNAGREVAAFWGRRTRAYVAMRGLAWLWHWRVGHDAADCWRVCVLGLEIGVRPRLPSLAERLRAIAARQTGRALRSGRRDAAREGVR